MYTFYCKTFRMNNFILYTYHIVSSITSRLFFKQWYYYSEAKCNMCTGVHKLKHLAASVIMFLMYV